MKQLIVWLALVVLLVSAGQVRAGTLLAVLNDENPEIYFVNPVSGVLVGTISIGVSNALALAADDTSQTFYYGGKGSLRRVSYDGTGDSLVGTYFGDQTGILGMGFNPQTNTLYGFRMGSLFTIDTATAELTLVAGYGGDLGIQSIDVDPLTGRIFAADELSSRILELHTNGTYDVLFGYPPGRTDVDGLAVAQGLIYIIEDGAEDPITLLNQSDGSVLGTLPSPYVVNGSNAGGAIFSPVPEPMSLVLWSGLGAVGLIAVRRRRKVA